MLANAEVMSRLRSLLFALLAAVVDDPSLPLSSPARPLSSHSVSVSCSPTRSPSGSTAPSVAVSMLDTDPADDIRRADNCSGCSGDERDEAEEAEEAVVEAVAMLLALAERSLLVVVAAAGDLKMFPAVFLPPDIDFRPGDDFPGDEFPRDGELKLLPIPPPRDEAEEGGLVLPAAPEGLVLIGVTFKAWLRTFALFCKRVFLLVGEEVLL
jgi:hypothetical protein